MVINKENLFKDMSDIFVSCLEDCKVLSDLNFMEFINNKTKINEEIFTVKNELGLKLEVIRKGFAIKQIGLNNNNFLLEYKDIDSYFNNNDILLNSFVGPIAGRIEKGIIKLDDKQIELKTDDNDNYIHGMKEKWSDLLFDISAKSFDDFDILEGNSEQHNLELDSLFIITMNLKI
jgi:galactose mutarotase-like enzyme